MKRKGFTLVELLAVIVILAIIALIATPMILGVIEDARKGSAKSSALGYVDAVEKSSLVYAVNNGASFKDGKYEVDGKNLKQNDNVIYTVDYKGDTAIGTITISNGEVTEAELTFKSIINKVVEVTENTAEIKETDEPENEEPEVVYGATKVDAQIGETHNGIVYLDPTNLTAECNESNAISTTGTKIGCMKWYIFDDSGDNYTMILDHNTTPLVAYNLTGSNTEMKEVKNELDKLVSEAEWKITPRLITADEVAEITGAKETLSWTSDKTYASTPVTGKSVSWFRLDGADGTDTTWQTLVVSAQGASKYAWLYDNTCGCISYGCNISDDNKYEYGTAGSTNCTHGYWTSTPVVGKSNEAWDVYMAGGLYCSHVGANGMRGVRPVITISKSIIS